MNLHLESSIKFTSNTLCDPPLGKLNQETKSCITKYIPLCDSAAHTGTLLFVLRSPSETNEVSYCHSSLVTTPPSIRICDKSKIEMTKVLIHRVGKNGGHFYGENFIYKYPTDRHINSSQHMGILHEFSNCVRETSNHGHNTQKLTGVIPKEKLQSMNPTALQMHLCSWKLTGEVN